MMASRDVLIKSFIELFRKFSRDLSTAYGTHDNELKSLHSSVVLFSTTCPEKCQELFHTFIVVPYGDHINARNEEFFMSDEFAAKISDHDHEIRGLAQTDALSLLKRLRSIWTQVADADKDNIWKYMTALARISNLVVAGKEARV